MKTTNSPSLLPALQLLLSSGFCHPALQWQYAGIPLLHPILRFEHSGAYAQQVVNDDGRTLQVLSVEPPCLLDSHTLQQFSPPQLCAADFVLHTLQPQSLARYIASLLGITGEPQPFGAPLLYLLPTQGLPILLSLSFQPAELAEHLRKSHSHFGTSFAFLTISPLAIHTHLATVQRELGYPLCAMVQDMLSHPAPLAAFRHAPHTCSSSLGFPPPPHCSWEQLHIDIFTCDSAPAPHADISADRLAATYRAPSGARLKAMGPLPLRSLHPKLFSHRAPTALWLLLRRYAAGDGLLLSPTSTAARTRLNTARKELARVLSELFGIPSSPFHRATPRASQAKFSIAIKQDSF